MSEPGDFDTGEVSKWHGPDDLRGALYTMRDAAFLRHPRYEEQQQRAKRDGAHLLILEFADKTVERLRLLDVPAFAHSILRTPTEQAAAFAKGNSRKNGTEPYPHGGTAVDIIHSKFGWNLSREQWLIFGHVGKEVAKLRGIDIRWGGDPEYGFYDPAHWELAHWRERQKELLR